MRKFFNFIGILMMMVSFTLALGGNKEASTFGLMLGGILYLGTIKKSIKN